MSSTVADTIKKLREKEGTSKMALAKKLGLEYGCYKEYENPSKKDYNDVVINSIAEYFHVSVDYLFGRTDVKFDTSHLTSKQWDLVMKSLGGEHNSNITYED